MAKVLSTNTYTRIRGAEGAAAGSGDTKTLRSRCRSLPSIAWRARVTPLANHSQIVSLRVVTLFRNAGRAPQCVRTTHAERARDYLTPGVDERGRAGHAHALTSHPASDDSLSSRTLWRHRKGRDAVHADAAPDESRVDEHASISASSNRPTFASCAHDSVTSGDPRHPTTEEHDRAQPAQLNTRVSPTSGRTVGSLSRN